MRACVCMYVCTCDGTSIDTRMTCICSYCPGGPDSDFEYSTQSYTGYEVNIIVHAYMLMHTIRVHMHIICLLLHPLSLIIVLIILSLLQ